ncbi:MAG: 3-deoxy-D-manno-octulosonic acid transferase [Candidatus Brocadiae bacterium]|nr:3-deoxy-D-manno-octulosonic acid transferase [Candidatus Brocadiia bacterium]
MSFILDCLYLLAGVVVLPYWLWKLPQAPRYRAGLLQRLGFSPRMPEAARRLWVHCASVGEAAIPRQLVARFRRRHPDWHIVFSTNTNTGAARLHELYPESPVFYMPLDLSPCVRTALSRVRPDVVLLVELEFWPNFVRACRTQGVRTAIINGRIGVRSRHLLGVLGLLCRGLWDSVQVCCARSSDDAAGFLAAGMPPAKVFNCGSLKCDNLTVEVDPAKERYLRRLFAIAPGVPVLVGGSTHHGEESILATLYRDLRLKHRGLRLIIAPRHIERAREAAAAVRARGLPVLRKTELEGGKAVASSSEVIVVDTVGDLVACYALATCAFVGRSLMAPGGGQNMMEPAALGKPVLIGPYTANFGPEMSHLTSAGAALVVRGPRELARQVDRLLSDPALADQMGKAGQRIVRESRGATERALSRLECLFRDGR